MRSRLNNLIYVSEDKYINPLIHVFFYVTLAVGMAFVFFPDVTGAVDSRLYELTTVADGSHATSLWGIGALIVTAANFIAYAYRKPWLGPLVSMAGFMLWFYAFWIYASGGFLYGALVTSLPNMVFWAWQFVQVRKYHTRHKTKD